MNPKKLQVGWTMVLLVVALLWVINTTRSQDQEMYFSEFMGLVNAGKVLEVAIRGSQINGTLSGGEKFRTYVPKNYDATSLLLLKNVRVKTLPEETGGFLGVLLSWLPMLLLIGVWIFFMRRGQGLGGISALTKSRHKLFEHHTGVTFEDVAGVEEAKEELGEIIEFLKNPQKFRQLGGKIPKGVLLVGPPGTGKTLLARAVAGEAGVPFFSLSGSDFVELLVGLGAARVRDLFAEAKKKGPCIIFIDELDAVGRHRGAGLGGGHDEREQTLNQLLVEMDGFESTEGVIILAATNRPDILDPALLRAGRFDRQVVVDRPDIKAREAILRVHTKKVRLAPDVNLATIARATPGLVGADLANIVNEAALYAARYNRQCVGNEDLEFAKDKVTMGAERKSRVLSQEERKVIATHEAGHTLVAKMFPGADPLYKVSIIPRGQALGVTWQLPERDRHNYSRDYLLGRITILLGGRVAEERELGVSTTGAADDLGKATELARKMVCEWGMSEKLGPRTFGHRQEMVFLGKEIGRATDYSEETAKLVDEEINRIIRECSDGARAIVCENLTILRQIAAALMERETLGSEDLEEIWRRSAHSC